MWPEHHEAKRQHVCGTDGLQADHIVPIADGGDEFDLDNVRTLCVPCHKKVTATWRTEVAARNREAKAVSPVASKRIGNATQLSFDVRTT